MSVNLQPANILTAFQYETVGTKVLLLNSFLRHLERAVLAFDFNAETNPAVTTTGQGFITLPPEAYKTVSAGVGRKRADAASYVLRSWRGQVGAYLRREYAAPVESLAVVVYTKAAYLADPDVAGDTEEVKRIEQSGATHVIVAVLAAAGPIAPLSPGRLVSNLAGGNKDALAWNAEKIRSVARESVAYYNEWDVVAD